MLLPLEQKVICCKWVFKVKYYLDNSLEKYEARFVAQRFSQVHGINYIEIFRSIIKYISLRIFLAIVIMLEMISIQISMVKAYLESALSQNKQLIFIRIL